ncbi:MAG: hypothetical protein GXP53_06650 [Deltaproteobacteria bacterium]|nr:hypothetical protein [Deltaproteobacteria bacterium]
MIQLRRYLTGIVISGLLMAFPASPVSAGSLFEQYANKTAAGLDAETADMGKQIREVFTERSINGYQRKIDFADYFANFKKIILYGAKLANYGEYKTDLLFARDKEIFMDLPDAPKGDKAEQADYADKKYEEIKKNVKEEIDTYVDLIGISLDACEIMANNDLSGFTANEENRNRIRTYLLESEAYRKFSSRVDRLKKGWPDIERRISLQVKQWTPAPKNPDDPLIDTAITGAL